jgi:hypothetical protein
LKVCAVNPKGINTPFRLVDSAEGKSEIMENFHYKKRVVPMYRHKKRKVSTANLINLFNQSVAQDSVYFVNFFLFQPIF